MASDRRETTIADLPAEPVTVRARCECCKVKRLFRCVRVRVVNREKLGVESIVKATCLTCLRETTA